VRTYDPASGSGLSTWTQSQRKRLHRYKRETSNPVHVPDRAQLDAFAIEKARVEYNDRHGYDPDVKALADMTAIPVKRIEDVRKLTRPVSSADQVLQAGGAIPDHMDEATEYVYDEADKTDRTILEHMTGFGGAEMLSKTELAKKLNTTPSTITRRTARLSLKIQEINDELASLTK